MTESNDTLEERVASRLEADEAVVGPCPRCGVDVPRVIPAGTSGPIAAMLRRIVVFCSACGAAEEARERAEERAKLLRERSGRSDLPIGLRDLSWETYDTSRRGAKGALAAAQAWARGQHTHRGLLLTGPVGVGKTRLAATALWAALTDFEIVRPVPVADDSVRLAGDEDEPIHGIAVRYVNVAELVVKLSAAFGDAERTQALRVLTGRGAIVLDDLDKVAPTQSVLAHLYTAIDGRVQNRTPMIVTTNLTPEQLVEKFARPGRGEDEDQRRVAAEAIVSRLLGHCSVHGITGKDGRRG